MCNSNDVYSPWLINAALRQKPSEGKYTETRIHMLLEYTAVFRSLKGVESLSEYIGWPNWQGRSETDAIREQKIYGGEGGVVPMKSHVHVLHLHT